MSVTATPTAVCATVFPEAIVACNRAYSASSRASLSVMLVAPYFQGTSPRASPFSMASGRA